MNKNLYKKYKGTWGLTDAEINRFIDVCYTNISPIFIKPKRRTNHMKKLIVLLTAVVVMFGATSAFAIGSNLEYFDEMSVLYKIKSDDFLLTTKYIDVGVEAGILNLGNPFNNYVEETYIAGVVSVKEVHLLNRLWSWITNR